MAFVAAGAWTVSRAGSIAIDRRWIGAGGIALGLVGIGSFAYHGPQPSWGGVAHDGSIALLLGCVAVVAVRRLRRGAPVASRVALAALAAGGVAWLLGHTDGPLCDPDSRLQLHAVWHVLSALATFCFFERRVARTGRNRSKNG